MVSWWVQGRGWVFLEESGVGFVGGECGGGGEGDGEGVDIVGEF